MTRAQQVQVGVVACDALRLVGLQTILEEMDGLMARAVLLDEALAADDLAAVLLDGACVENLEDVVERFRQERTAAKVVVLGERFDSGRVQAIIGAGARGYLDDTADESEIRMAMRVVLDGSVWAPRKVLARLIEAGEVVYAPDESAEKLAKKMTQREMEVLRLLMSGRTNRQIAEAMGVEAVTVKAHLGRMLRKAGVKNRVELTLKAMLGGSQGLAEA